MPMPVAEIKNLRRAVLSTSPQVGLFAIPEPVDPVGITAPSALKCVTHVLAHPLPMSPVHTAFKEDGVGWAVSLYCALYERWHKRNIRTLENVNPRNLDIELYRELCHKYGGSFSEGRLQGDLVLSELEGGGGGNPSE
jgi:hypothetical protein